MAFDNLGKRWLKAHELYNSLFHFLLMLPYTWADFVVTARRILILRVTSSCCQGSDFKIGRIIDSATGIKKSFLPRTFFTFNRPANSPASHELLLISGSRVYRAVVKYHTEYNRAPSFGTNYWTRKRKNVYFLFIMTFWIRSTSDQQWQSAFHSENSATMGHMKHVPLHLSVTWMTDVIAPYPRKCHQIIPVCFGSVHPLMCLLWSLILLKYISKLAVSRIRFLFIPLIHNVNYTSFYKRQPW